MGKKGKTPASVTYVRELTKAELKELKTPNKNAKKPDKYVMVKTEDIEFSQTDIRKKMTDGESLAEICH